jgi:catechol 2,3-dioxygenase-like lactoylglutathione lyase family enzyme
MFTHITLGANDVEASRRFYDAVLGALGHAPGLVSDQPRPGVWYRTPRGMLGVVTPIDGQPACHANGGTVGFAAATPEAVVAFSEAGVAAGGTVIEDPAGLRVTPFGPMHLAYLRDPSGNKICAVHRPG